MKTALISFALVAVALVFADYAYFRGFDDGADTSTCLISLQVDGTQAIKKEPSCLRISGRAPPPRLFPGSVGDEPTVWQRIDR